MIVGRDLFDLVFAQPIGPNKRCQICAGSPMTFGRDVFDLVFAQSKRKVIKTHKQKSPKTQLLKKVHEVQCMPQNSKIIDFRHMNCRGSVFFLICVATPDFQNHMNR